MKAKKTIQNCHYRTDNLDRQKQAGYFELLTKYEDELLSGKKPDPYKYLNKCKKSEQKKMVFSLNLATLFLTGKERKKNSQTVLSKTLMEKARRKCYKNIINQCK